MYQWIYAVLLIAHVTYMSFLTAYGLNTLEDKHDQETTTNNTAVIEYDIPIVLTAYFITYPSLMTLFFACFYYVGTWTRGPKTLSWHTIWNAIRGVFQTVIGLVHLSSLLAWLLPVAFNVLVAEINVNSALGLSHDFLFRLLCFVVTNLLHVLHIKTIEPILKCIFVGLKQRFIIYSLLYGSLFETENLSILILCHQSFKDYQFCIKFNVN